MAVCCSWRMSMEGSSRHLRRLAHGVGIEAGEAGEGGVHEAATRDSLTPERAEEARERALEQIKSERGTPLEEELLRDLDELFLTHGKRALELLREEGAAAELEKNQEEAVEAIVEADGSRPTIRVGEAVAFDFKDKVLKRSLGRWVDAATKFRDGIERTAASVGRIDRDRRHQGTGFVVAENLVLTNRHVLQQIGEPDAQGGWRFLGEPSITFDVDPSSGRKRSFEILGVVAAGPAEIPLFAPGLDFGLLDYAVLECEPGDDFPPPLPVEGDSSKILSTRPVYTIGYPARPASGHYEFEVLERLFAHRYGVKRFAPGEIDAELGALSGDDGRVSFGHDATTLGGSSGSCVVDFGNDGHLAVGLHFGGKPGALNYAHANARLR